MRVVRLRLRVTPHTRLTPPTSRPHNHSEIAQDYKKDLRFAGSALLALQEVGVCVGLEKGWM